MSDADYEILLDGNGVFLKIFLNLIMRETHSVWNRTSFKEGCVDPATITLGKLFEDCAT